MILLNISKGYFIPSVFNPHIHLVTTNIEADGKRIDLHHLGIRKSEPARKYIEEAFGLVKAEAQKKQVFQFELVSVQRVQYGKSETKRAIQNVLDHVIGHYKFTSLPELNAVLKQYNVMAERGSANSRVYRHKGLLYRVIDEHGNPIGVPVKASSFYNKPILSSLEEKFKGNEAKRIPHKARVKNVIDMALLGKKLSLREIVKELEKQGIHTALRENEAGLIYGITYVDHRSKCVFNGSALGKQYSAKAIQERCQQGAAVEQKTALQLAEKQQISQQQLNAQTEIKPAISQAQHSPGQTIQIPDIGKALDALLQPEHATDYLPYQLKKNKKKKKRKRISNNQ